MKFMPKVADGKDKEAVSAKDGTFPREPEDATATAAATAAVRALLTPEQNAASPDDMVARYLRATSGDAKHAAHRLQATLAWWAAESPVSMFCTACRGLPCSHYMQVMCRDRSSRPVIYSQIGLAHNKDIEDNRRHMISTFEAAIALMPPGVEAWCWVLDFHKFSLRDCDPRLARIFLNLAATHYPERLGHFWIVDAPALFGTLWSAVQRFIDPKTREKIAFLSLKKREQLTSVMAEHFDDETVAWLVVEMEDNRRERGPEEQPKSYPYADLARAGEAADEAAGRHCNLGSPAYLAELRAWEGPLPPQLTANAAHADDSTEAEAAASTE